MELLTYLKENNIDHLEENGTVAMHDHWDLEDTKITKLPEKLSVGRSLYLDAKNITNLAYRENCGIYKRIIFAAYVNGEIQIAASCFLGNIEKFESEVDKKYSGAESEKYKQSARECISELEQMRNRKN